MIRPAESIDYRTCRVGAEESTESVGHDHKDTLRRGTDVGGSFLFDEKRARNVEEVECDPINDHREDQENGTRSRIADTEESEAEHPGQHRDQHHPFDAEASQEEGNQQDAECFGHLREREQDYRVAHDGRVGVLGHRAEVLNVTVAEGIGNLKAAPSSIEKMKKIAMRFSLKRANARSPSVSIHDWLFRA